MTVRLRFAPSPTGRLHIGGARTALYNWAYARRLGGRFILRVEDTDPERSTAEYERAILEGLGWLGLDWDEGPDVGGDHGPYRQSERAASHAKVATRLEGEGHGYRCFCTRERLDELRTRQQEAGETPRYDGRCRELSLDEVESRIAVGEPSVLRFRVPAGRTSFPDSIRGDVSFDNAEIDDWVMVRVDGTPTYNFVVVCDDSAMEITHVVRGEEHLVNTPKQVLLYGALGLAPPGFAHLPLLLGDDGKKLSKRTGDTALEAYREQGFPPEAVLNFLALQGWAPDETTQVFGTELLVECFEPAAVRKGGSIFDLEKFLWMSGEYLRAEPLEQTAARALPFVVAAGSASADELEADLERWHAAVATTRERVRTYSEIPARLAWLFAADDAYEIDPKAAKNARKHEDAAGTLAAYRDWLAPRVVDGVDADALRTDTKAWVGERGVKIPALFQPLRLALTGEPGGPDLFELIDLLGAERTAARLARGIALLGSP